MMRCVRCVMPSTWAGITFDEEGVCNICRNYEKKSIIDWEERQEILKGILETYRERAEKTENKYDCLVGLSGGKDSVYTLWAAKRKYNLRPLAVTFDHGIPMCSEAEYNLQEIPKLLDADHLRFSIGKKFRNAMCRKATEKAGDWCFFCHLGVGAFPTRISKMFDIPLQLWGEPSSTYQTSGNSYTIDQFEEQDFDHYKTIFQAGVTPNIIQPEGYEDRDMMPFQWPWNHAGTGVYKPRALYLGNFEDWNQKEHVDIITRELGWKHIPTRVSFVDWDKCDCVEGEELRDVQKFHRRGLSRVAFETSKEIRDGFMSREEAMKLVEEYEKKIPTLDVSWICNELGFKNKEELLGMTKGI